MMLKCPQNNCNYESDSEKGIAVHHKKMHGTSIAKEEKTCIVCGDIFESYIDARACSRECTGQVISKAKTKKGHVVECEECGSNIRVPNWKYKWNIDRDLNFYCDLGCKADYQTGVTQEDHHNWKGGYDDYYGDNWSEMRKRVLERDNHSCRVCGISKDKLGKEPDVHHIKPRREFDVVENSNTMDNLIALCTKHHGKVEYGVIECPEVNNE